MMNTLYLSRRLFAMTAMFLLAVAGIASAANLNIVTSTEDLAAICREVGGDHITVDSIAKGYQDPHFVEPKPSFLLKLQKADLMVVVGLQLEIGWLPALITQSRNARIQPGAAGYVDVSSSAEILDLPTGTVTRAMGDVHPLGNPHYWLDPENGRRIARALKDKLAAAQPADAAYFTSRLADFEQRLTAAEKTWDAKMAPFRGRQVVTYHRSFTNFVKRYGLVVVNYVEPKPGIPPTPAHTLEVITQMKRDNVKLLLIEPYFDHRTPDSIAKQSGGEVVVLLPSVGGEKKVVTYFDLFEYDVNLLAAAFSRNK